MRSFLAAAFILTVCVCFTIQLPAQGGSQTVTLTANAAVFGTPNENQAPLRRLPDYTAITVTRR
jgi:hypothetical protein